jgi:hypothetical protein
MVTKGGRTFLVGFAMLKNVIMSFSKLKRMAEKTYDPLQEYKNLPVVRMLFPDVYISFLLRAMDLFTSPVYEDTPFLYNPSMKLSLFTQFSKWLSFSNRSTIYALNDVVTSVLPVKTHVNEIPYTVFYREVSQDPNVVVLTESGKKLGYVYRLYPKQDFREAIQAWYRFPSDKYFITPVAYEQEGSPMGHAMVLMIQKSKRGQVFFRVLNSYSEDVDPIEHVVLYLKKQLQDALPFAVVTFLESYCPLLQRDLGPNCTMWQALFMTLVAKFPDFFQNPEPLLAELAMNPHLNLVMFELYFFFFILSRDVRFVESLVFTEYNMVHAVQRKHKRVLKNRAVWDNEVRLIVDYFFDLPNCPELNNNVKQCEKKRGCEVLHKQSLCARTSSKWPAVHTLTLQQMSIELVSIVKVLCDDGLLPFPFVDNILDGFVYVYVQDFIKHIWRQKTKKAVKKYIKKMKRYRLLRKDVFVDDFFPKKPPPEKTLADVVE